MKQGICKLLAACTVAALVGTVGVAQTTVVETTSGGATTATSATTTTTSPVVTEGTISEFSPNTIVVRSTTSAAPVRYVARKTTTYVDETGAPVSIETVKSGLPVTVQYVQEGNEMVASRVVVRRTTAVQPAPTVVEKRATTTTTTTTKGKKKDADDDDD